MKNYKPKNVKVSDKYWKENLMKVLQVFAEHELTWHRDYWSDYGISHSDKKKIEQAFEVYNRQVKPRKECADGCDCVSDHFQNDCSRDM
jgi:hypothetical protein